MSEDTPARWRGALSVSCALLFACAAGRTVVPQAPAKVSSKAVAAPNAKNASAEIASTVTACVPSEVRVCWSALVAPTAQQTARQARYTELAAAHRAQSAALRDAEHAACAFVSSEDRDMSPFARGEDIVSASRLREHVQIGGKVKLRATGAIVVFRAVPGLDAPALQRIIDCHLARNAASAHPMPELGDCPLAPRGVEVKVSEADEVVVVAEVRSSDPSVSEEIVRRATAIHPGG